MYEQKHFLQKSVETLKSIPETEAEEIPNTLDSVAKERETYSPGFWKKLFSKKDRLYIETGDELFGVQKYLEKVGKRTDAAAIVNMARSSRGQAQTMIGSVQYDLFSGKAKPF